MTHIGLEGNGNWSCLDKEYFLMQYRTEVGYDRGLNRYLGESFHPGVAIYHIDENVNHTKFDSRRLVDIEEANGIEMGNSKGQNDHLWYLGIVSIFDSISHPNSFSFLGYPSHSFNPSHAIQEFMHPLLGWENHGATSGHMEE